MNGRDQPTVIIIFGVSGDLAGRKVLPSLYQLLKDGLLPPKFRVIGTTRQDLTKEDLLKTIELCVLETDKVCDPAVLKKFNNIFEVIRFDPTAEADYEELKKHLSKLEEKDGVCFNRLFYLSIPPQIYMPIIRALGKSDLSHGCSEHKRGTSRLLVEKPFGYGLKSAKTLIKQTDKYFTEGQIFRIDHYLAKETAQNILTFRQHNPLFNDIWNNRQIRRISIKALESIGIEGRVNFYENVGALRDLVQSHLMQLMALTTMDLPADIDSSKSIHKEKIKLLNRAELEKMNRGSIIRGQYKSYRKEVGNRRSSIETYAKLTLRIKSKRWAGVPIVLETGKALSKKSTTITIEFALDKNEDCNELTIRIQPDEGIDIKLFVKKPGFDNEVQPATMDFSYAVAFGDQAHPDAYERVIMDAIRGDQSLFASSREVIRSWQILQPVIDRWQGNAADLAIYDNGSEGPFGRDLLN